MSSNTLCMDDVQKAKDYFDSLDEDIMKTGEWLMQYGVGHLNGGHSGRYPFGSGEDPYQHNHVFLGQIDTMAKSGMKEKEIAVALGFKTTSELRAAKSMATNYNKLRDIETIRGYVSQGYNYSEIGRKMGISESTVRSKLNERVSANAQKLDIAKDKLRSKVAEGIYPDVGAGTEYQLGITRSRLDNALIQLQAEGYNVHEIKVEQAGNAGKYTTLRVLSDGNTDRETVSKNRDKIKPIYDRQAQSEDGSFYVTDKMEYPAALSSSRILVRYAEDKDANGHYGVEKDGTIELRRGVEDISIGNSLYSQVRINVDNKAYAKGIAWYKDDIPDGYDVVINTNKHRGTPLINDADPNHQVLKKLKNDPNNPFGASVLPGVAGTDDDQFKCGQRKYIDPKTGEEKLSVINKVNDAGKWGEWSKTLASQMLSKQPNALIKQQMEKKYKESKEEFDAIMALTNPAVKQKMLVDFGDECDAAAVELKGAAMPRMAAHVILPIPTLKNNEIYAPNYEDGETVVLIRYPHGGRFEIPELVVNNKNKEAIACMKNAPDAVGINAYVAETLSGADFDGDTAMVIPNNDHKIKTAPRLKGLVGFEPKELYKLPDDAPEMKDRTKQMEMGKVSNLITDMTLQGATEEHLERAVKHSMVVIDAQKHHLNWKQSEIDNGIAELKLLYQGGRRNGASTIISRASAEARTDLRRSEGLLYKIDPNTGEKVYQLETNEKKLKYIDKNGKEVTRTSKITKMEKAFLEGKDASALSSGLPQEKYYVDYANKMHDLGNLARKNSVGLKQEYDPNAAKIYAEEVKSLENKLSLAKINAPYERQAQLAANAMAQTKINNYGGELSKEEKKRIKAQCLTAARANVGAGKQYVNPTEREWEAIQAGAISHSKLSDILKNSDSGRIKELATPKATVKITDSKVALMKALAANGNTNAQIAMRLGISASTVGKYLSDTKKVKEVG